MEKLIVLYIFMLFGSVVAYRETDLWNAVKDGNLDMVNDALSYGADPEYVNLDDSNTGQFSALHYASYLNHPLIVSAILDTGAYINQGTRTDSNNPLILASGAGNIETVNLLIERGASVDWRQLGLTALYAAAGGNHLEVMNALLDAGADINLDFKGRTPLYIASEKGYIDAVDLLITHDANLDLQRWDDGWTALMTSIKEGFLDIAEELIDANPDLEVANDYGYAALHIAAKYNQPEIAQYLLKSGANPNQRDNAGRTPRDIARDEGITQELDSFSNLLSSSNDYNLDYNYLSSSNEYDLDYNYVSSSNDYDLDLWNAVQAGNLGQVKEALASGANPEWVNPDPIFSEQNPGRMNIEKWMKRDEWTPLHWASYYNDPEIVSALLDSGYSGYDIKYDINKRSDGRYTPLLLASRYGHYDIVKLLIEHGASINWQSLGFTALHYAALGKYSENPDFIRIMKALLNAGARTDSEHNGRTPIMLASKYGNIDSVQLLINRGANLDMQTWNGKQTALMIAIENGFYDVARALIDNGASIELVDEYGLTALHYAAKNNQPKIAQYLLQKGANPNQQDNKGRTPLDIAIEQGITNVDSFSVIIDGYLDQWNEDNAGNHDLVYDDIVEPEAEPMINFVKSEYVPSEYFPVQYPDPVEYPEYVPSEYVPAHYVPDAPSDKKQSSNYNLYMVGGGAIMSMAISFANIVLQWN